MALTTDQLASARSFLSDQGSSAIQSILISGATGGTFTITWNGQTTSALAYNASAAAVQTALNALSNVGTGNLNVNNTAPYMLYFGGTLAGAAEALVTVNSSLTPGTATATVTQVAIGGVYAFTDAELSSFYDLSDQNFFLAICYAFRALMADFARLNDYTAGQTQEKKSQIFNHLQAMQDLYQRWAMADRQVQFSRMTQVPPRVRAYPFTSGVPATSLSVRPPDRFNPWGK